MRFQSKLQYAADKYLKTDCDENYSSEKFGFSAETISYSFAYFQTRHADDESYGCNIKGCSKGLKQIVIRNCKANRKSIYAGGNSLNEKNCKRKVSCVLGIIFRMKGRPEHFAAYIRKQD